MKYFRIIFVLLFSPFAKNKSIRGGSGFNREGVGNGNRAYGSSQHRNK